MTSAEKEPFQAQANADKERYDEELRVFKANGGVITNSNGKPTKKSRQEAKDPDLPKRPRAAFFLYSVAMRETVKAKNPTFKVTDIAKELGRLWREVDETTKAHYQQKADVEKEEYHKKMGVYRQKKQEEERAKREEEQTRLAKVKQEQQEQQQQQRVQYQNSSSSSHNSHNQQHHQYIQNNQ